MTVGHADFPSSSHPSIQRTAVKDEVPKYFANIPSSAEAWVNIDPLTVSSSCVRIEALYRDMLCHQSNPDHGQDCNCPKLRRHYGSNLYKCHYFACPHRRYGFKKESECAGHIENHHRRPWKCSAQSCDFAVIGFQTHAALEMHRMKFHKMVPAADFIESSVLEDEALYPLLYELVDSGNIGELEVMWPACRSKVNDLTAADLIAMAAAQGSLPIVQMLLEWDDKRQEPRNEKVKLGLVVNDAVQSGNLELTRWILDKATAWGCRGRTNTRYRDVVVAVLKSESAEIFETWQDVIMSDRYAQDSPLWRGLFEETVLSTARRFPEQQMRMFGSWRRLAERGSLSLEHLGQGLVNVAKTTCSIDQAKVLLELGAPIDFPRPWSNHGYTALHWTSKKTTEEAAEFMRFLILEGAEPHVPFGRTRPSDGAGAQNIHRWLNVTWDQLVDLGESERKRRRREMPDVVIRTKGTSE